MVLRRAALSLALVALALSQPVRASASPRATDRPPSPFKLDPVIDGVLVATGAAVWTALSIVTKETPGPRCDPCAPDDLNGLDRPVIHFSSESADIGSDVMLFAVPALALGGALLNLEGRWGWSGALEDAVLIAEAVALSAAAQQIVRHAARRPRPFMYRADARPEDRADADSTLSFYSGHTAATFAAATAFAYTYTVRRPRSRWRLLVWIGALLAAASVPLLRVAAGEHFWSDVIVGAAVGSGFGVLVPMLHRNREGEGSTGTSITTTTLHVTPTWLGVGGTF
jgi:membrane-associated phospholipid phosphatase